MLGIPLLDVCRVEPSGEAVIAGVAAPNSTVILLDGDTPIAQVIADATGSWVIVLDEPLSPGDHQLSLRAEEPGGGAKLVPHLAESWKRVDPKTLVVKLRKGVRFHNGDELTSDDIAFTFSPERMTGKNPTILNCKRYFVHLAKVVAVDK